MANPANSSFNLCRIKIYEGEVVPVENSLKATRRPLWGAERAASASDWALLRSRVFGDVAIHQAGHQPEFLVRGEIDLGFKSLVARQADSDLSLSRRDQQGFAKSFEFGHMADELTVQAKTAALLRFHLKVNFRSDLGILDADLFCHPHAQLRFLAGLKNHFLSEVLIARLPDDDLVGAGKK